MAKQTQVATVLGDSNHNIMIQANGNNNVSAYLSLIDTQLTEAELQFHDATSPLTNLPSEVKTNAYNKWVLLRDIAATAKQMLQP